MEKTFTVIFDFDGTLANTIDEIYEILEKLSGEFTHKKFSFKEIMKYKDTNISKLFKLANVSMVNMPKILIRYKLELAKRIHNIKPYEGIDEMLSILKNDLKCRIGILTSNSKDNVDFFLNKYNMDFFEFISTDSPFFGKNVKLIKLLKKYNINKDSVLYVGDEKRDIDAAKKVKIKMIAVSWGVNSAELLKKNGPDYLVDAPEQIPDVIKNLLN